MNFLLSLGESVVFNPLKLKRFSTPIINRTFLSICFLMLITFQTYGQDDSWNKIYESENIMASYKTIRCDTFRLVGIRIEKKVAETIEMTWKNSITLKDELSMKFEMSNPADNFLIVDKKIFEVNSCDYLTPQLAIDLPDRIVMKSDTTNSELNVDTSLSLLNYEISGVQFIDVIEKKK